MSKAKRAIIMAAGIGNRMWPVTEDTPKPLIKIHGTSMIETMITALINSGIPDIYIVVGYLKEKFFYLREKYPEVHLIENPYYDMSNNISSLYMAREHLGSCFIVDGDQYVKNESLFDMEISNSGYMCVWKEEPTEEWLLDVQDGRVVGCSRTGGERGWELHSISFWNDEDGEKLKRHLEIEFGEKNNREIYWDDIALFCYPGEYQLGIREMDKEAAIEADTFEELCRLDESYVRLKEGKRKRLRNGGDYEKN